MQETPGASDTVRIPPGRNALIQLAGIGMMIALPAGAIVADFVFGAPTSRLDYTINGWFLLLWMAVGAFVGWRRHKRVGLVADGAGITDVGLFSSRSWPWSDVAAFGWDVDRQPVIAVCLKGERVAHHVATSAAPIEQVRAGLEALAPVAAAHGVEVVDGPDTTAAWWPLRASAPVRSTSGR